MPRIKVTVYSRSLDQIQNENLREEAKGWNAEECVTAGTAICIPDDGSGPMEGFWRQPCGPGMVVWGTSTSDWIESDSLEDLFRKYLKNFY